MLWDTLKCMPPGKSEHLSIASECSLKHRLKVVLMLVEECANAAGLQIRMHSPPLTVPHTPSFIPVLENFTRSNKQCVVEQSCADHTLLPERVCDKLVDVHCGHFRGVITFGNLTVESVLLHPDPNTLGWFGLF